MTRFKRKMDGLQKRGESDFKAGQPIASYYSLPTSMLWNERYGEQGRAFYEKGWREAKEQTREEASKSSATHH